MVNRFTLYIKIIIFKCSITVSIRAKITQCLYYKASCFVIEIMMISLVPVFFIQSELSSHNNCIELLVTKLAFTSRCISILKFNIPLFNFNPIHIHYFFSFNINYLLLPYSCREGYVSSPQSTEKRRKNEIYTHYTVYA